jgi:hypothetical protein
MGAGIWFGTRRSVVQIHSPRPFFSTAYPSLLYFSRSSVDDFVDEQVLGGNWADVVFSFGPCGTRSGWIVQRLEARKCDGATANLFSSVCWAENEPTSSDSADPGDGGLRSSPYAKLCTRTTSAIGPSQVCGRSRGASDPEWWSPACRI